MDEDERKKYLMEIGSRIKELRTQKELSQEELAFRCGYTSRSTINKIELGINDVSQSKLKDIAEALGVPVGSLLGWGEFDKVYKLKSLEAGADLFDQVEETHGKAACEALSTFLKLDNVDQAETQNFMDFKLTQEKYLKEEGLSSGKAM